MKKIFKTIDYAACLNCPNDSCIKCSAYFRKNLGCIRLLSHFEQATNQYTGIVKHNSQTLNTQFSNVKKADIFAKYYYPFIIGINAVPENFNNDLKWGNLDNVKFPNKNTNPKDKRGLIWVTPLQDILDIINDTKHENRANEITDRLGLSIQSETDYVYLEYDKIFNEILFQPCHLSTQWDNPHLYLSYKKFDGYGRTRQRKGDDESRRMKELVHESIDDDEKYVYNVKSLGRCTEYSENISNFVGESMKRYAL